MSTLPTSKFPVAPSSFEYKTSTCFAPIAFWTSYVSACAYLLYLQNERVNFVDVLKMKLTYYPHAPQNWIFKCAIFASAEAPPTTDKALVNELRLVASEFTIAGLMTWKSRNGMNDLVIMNSNRILKQARDVKQKSEARREIDLTQHSIIVSIWRQTDELTTLTTDGTDEWCNQRNDGRWAFLK